MAFSDAERVSIDCAAGKIIGQRRNSTVHEFLGIPFAQQRRFERPKLLLTNNLCHDAAARGPTPWQPLGSNYLDDREACWEPKEAPSEDCLNLNVWTPSNAKDLPVLVWFFGGGFYTGAASLDLYDGAMLAEKGRLLVVTVNYRLGPFGFLYAPKHDCYGNLGLWDQQCALRWIQANISAFGGDPQRVTLFGESAGGAAIGFHLVCPTSWPLFERVIMQSGVPTCPWAMIPASEMERRSQELIDAVDGWANALTVEPKQLMQLGDFAPGILQHRFLPTVDGEFLTDEPHRLLLAGAFKRCPVLIGTLSDEGSVYLLDLLSQHGIDPDAGGCFQTVQSFQDFIALAMPQAPGFPSCNTDMKLQLAAHEYFPWHQPSWQTVRQAMSALIGDWNFVVDTYFWLKNLGRAKENTPTLFVYHFEHSPDKESRWPPWTGAKHGDEVAFVFGDPLRETPCTTYTSREKMLTQKVMEIWSAFTYSSPDTKKININSFEWLPWTEEKKFSIQIRGDSITIEGYNYERQCHFWKTLMPKLN